MNALVLAGLMLLGAEQEPGTVTLKSGVIVKTIKEGTGAAPTAKDSVKAHYRGTLPDGTEFDSSYKRGKPLVFKLAQVIPCWTEGMQRVKVGGSARFVCPPSTAYGKKGAGTKVPPDATLVFDVELLEVISPE